jgi:ABC-type arginine/histidine transport system permease subunit
MNTTTLRLARNLLLRSFVVGLVIALLLGLIVMAGWSTWIDLASAWFHTDEATLTPIILQFFMTIRFFLLFILLTPALAIHWTLKKDNPGKK